MLTTAKADVHCGREEGGEVQGEARGRQRWLVAGAGQHTAAPRAGTQMCRNQGSGCAPASMSHGSRSSPGLGDAGCPNVCPRAAAVHCLGTSSRASWWRRQLCSAAVPVTRAQQHAGAGAAADQQRAGGAAMDAGRGCAAAGCLKQRHPAPAAQQGAPIPWRVSMPRCMQGCAKPRPTRTSQLHCSIRTAPRPKHAHATSPEHAADPPDDVRVYGMPKWFLMLPAAGQTVAGAR